MPLGQGNLLAFCLGLTTPPPRALHPSCQWPFQPQIPQVSGLSGLTPVESLLLKNTPPTPTPAPGTPPLYLFSTPLCLHFLSFLCLWPLPPHLPPRAANALGAQRPSLPQHLWEAVLATSSKALVLGSGTPLVSSWASSCSPLPRPCGTISLQGPTG